MAVVVFVPSRIGEGFFTDLPAPTAGDDAKAITYDHDTGAFVYAAAGGTPGGSTTQVQYNNAGAFAGHSGMAYDDVNSRLTVTGGLVAGDWSPPSDSTAAVSIWNAARSTRVVTVDTTNSRVVLNRAAGSGSSTQIYSTGTIANFSLLALYPNDGTNTVSAFTVIPRGTGVSGIRSQFTIFNSDFIADPNNYEFGGMRATGSVLLLGTGKAGSGSILPFMLASGYLSDGSTNSGQLYLATTGYVGINNTSPTSLLDLAAGSTGRASLRIRAGTAPTTPNDGDAWNDGNAYALMVNGTNAVNTDGGLSVWMQSSTTARNVGRLLWQYTDKTDATRVTKGALTAYYQSTEHKAIHWSADSAGPLLSFGPVTTPIATPVLATGASATPDDIIAVLQALGLVKQS